MHHEGSLEFPDPPQEPPAPPGAAGCADSEAAARSKGQ